MFVLVQFRSLSFRVAPDSRNVQPLASPRPAGSARSARITRFSHISALGPKWTIKSTAEIDGIDKERQSGGKIVENNRLRLRAHVTENGIRDEVRTLYSLQLSIDRYKFLCAVSRVCHTFSQMGGQ